MQDADGPARHPLRRDGQPRDSQNPGGWLMPQAVLETAVATAEDLRIIRHSTLFGRLPPETFQRLFENQPVRVAGKDAVLCRWGAPADTCFIVLSGLIKLVRSGDGDGDVVLAVHGPGRALMLAEGLTGKPCSASAEAIGPVRLMCLDVGSLRESMARDARLSMALLAAAATDLKQLVVHIEELKAMTGPARLAAMILNLSEAKSGATEVTLPYPKQLIASRLGMQPESFSRAMAQLRTLGVSVSRDRLVIGDVARLRSFARYGA